MVIQRAFKPYINKLMWKKRFKEMSQTVVRKIVQGAIGKGLVLATKRVVIVHSITVIVIQRYTRGYLIRCTMRRQRKWALTLGKCVIRIQRFWRCSGEFLKAVQEVMALKKFESNKYRSLETVHEVLCHLHQDLLQSYSTVDPRIGLLTTQFLKRIGLAELIPFFNSSPLKSFKYVLDLKKKYNTAEKLLDAFEKWYRKNEKTMDKDTKKSFQKYGKNIFTEIMGYLWPKSPPTTEKGRLAIKVRD